MNLKIVGILSLSYMILLPMSDYLNCTMRGNDYICKRYFQASISISQHCEKYGFFFFLYGYKFKYQFKIVCGTLRKIMKISILLTCGFSCITHNEMKNQFQSAFTTSKFKEFQHELGSKIFCELSSKEEISTTSYYFIVDEDKIIERSINLFLS